MKLSFKFLLITFLSFIFGIYGYELSQNAYYKKLGIIAIKSEINFLKTMPHILNMVELKGAYFALWLKDLSAPDPFFVLPILMGVTMLIQQKMSQTPSASPETETQQKILTYGMPIFLTFLAFSWPSGLLLYWSISNILSIFQQFFVNKSNI